MAVTVTATVGASGANSYLSVAAADAIADLRLGTLSWDTATTDDKGRALIAATSGLDTLGYNGTRATETQALAWPRADVVCDGVTLPDDELPEPLLQATFDLAEALLTTPTLLRSPTTGGAALVPGVPNASLRRLKADVLELEWRTDVSPVATVNPLSALPHLATLLGCLTTSSVPGRTSGTLPTVRS